MTKSRSAVYSGGCWRDAATRWRKPGLVICDVRMPDGGGVALHRRVRAAYAEESPGFIFITGDMAAMLPLGDETSHVAMLAKPFTASDLDALLVQIASVRAR